MVRSLLLLALLQGCGPLNFTTRLTGTTTIPAGVAGSMLGALPLLAQLVDLDFDQNADFMMHQVTRDQVQLARVDTAQVSVLSPPGQDFAFLDSVQLLARSGDAETLFADASINATQPPPKSLAMTITATPEVTQEVSMAPMSFVMRGRGRQPTVDTHVQVELELHVEARRR